MVQAMLPIIEDEKAIFGETENALTTILPQICHFSKGHIW